MGLMGIVWRNKNAYVTSMLIIAFIIGQLLQSHKQTADSQASLDKMK